MSEPMSDADVKRRDARRAVADLYRTALSDLSNHVSALAVVDAFARAHEREHVLQAVRVVFTGECGYTEEEAAESIGSVLGVLDSDDGLPALLKAERKRALDEAESMLRSKLEMYDEDGGWKAVGECSLSDVFKKLRKETP